MNDIFLKGTIKNIQHSHTSNNTDYDRATLLVRNSNDKESIVDLVFKHFANKHKEGELITLLGQVRTFSKHTEDGKKHTNIYVNTYLDDVQQSIIDQEQENQSDNHFQISGIISKLNDIKYLNDNRCSLSFVIKNVISDKIISYLPCISWGKLAKKISSDQAIGSEIVVIGELRSREYKKFKQDDTFDIAISRELLVTDYYTIEEWNQLYEE